MTYLFWFNELELHSTSGPDNGRLVGRVIQESQQKLPKLQQGRKMRFI